MANLTHGFRIDEEKCKGCLACMRACPTHAIRVKDRKAHYTPDQCIDCGVCEPECPAEAIKPDTEPGLEEWLKLNTEYAKAWPNITVKRESPADAKEWDGNKDKLQYFSPKPGAGD